MLDAFSKLNAAYGEKAPQLQELAKLHKEVTDDGEKPEIYSSIGFSQVQTKFTSIKTPLGDKLQLLGAEKKKQQELETLVNSYSSKFSQYSKFIDQSASAIQKDMQGELEEQLKTVQQQGVAFSKESKATLKELSDLFSKIEAADISEKVVSIQEASLSDAKLQKTITKRIEALESSIMSKKQSNISESQLKDFHDTFRHFDREKSGTLSKLAFKAACAAVGEDIPDNKLEETFNGYDKDRDGKISFDEFITFISSVAKAGQSKSDILQAFRDLSGGNKFITEQQLRNNFDKEQAEQFLATLKKTDEGYDYEGYLESTFSQ
jgi:Ca2+-binding EF-hand superfamily protein